MHLIAVVARIPSQPSGKYGTHRVKQCPSSLRGCHSNGIHRVWHMFAWRTCSSPQGIFAKLATPQELRYLRMETFVTLGAKEHHTTCPRLNLLRYTGMISDNALRRKNPSQRNGRANTTVKTWTDTAVGSYSDDFVKLISSNRFYGSPRCLFHATILCTSHSIK